MIMGMLRNEDIISCSTFVNVDVWNLNKSTIAIAAAAI